MNNANKKKALLLVHRIPYPPDKGDKIRSWRLFKFLAEKFQLSAGFFVDDPEDHKYVEFLSDLCEDIKVIPLNPITARIKSVRGFLTGDALSFPYYRSQELLTWVNARRSSGFDLEVAFSSTMVPYLKGAVAPTFVDLVDADSAKWREYAKQQAFPMSWIYQREAKKLGEAEARTTQDASASFLITDEEAEIVRSHPNANRQKVDWYQNGVDTEYFDPNHEWDLEFTGKYIVFTGAMNYWANIDAVIWFVDNVWPKIRDVHPDLSFVIVGSNPDSKIEALARMPGIVVTGRVPDIRPWLHGAELSVAPLRIARGVQNKVLEAMAMTKPVVASPEAAAGISAENGKHFITSGEPGHMATSTLDLIADRPKSRQIGRAARAMVCERYGWEAQFERFSKKLTEFDLL